MKDQLQEPVDLVEMFRLIERMRRLIDNVIKDELKRLNMKDLNPTQALLLFNLEDNEMSPSQLCDGNHFHGTNPHYPLQKLTDMGYLHRRQDRGDRRMVKVKLSPKGQEIREVVRDLFSRRSQGLTEQGVVDSKNLNEVLAVLQRIERFLTQQIRYI